MYCQYCGRTLLKKEICSCSGAVKARNGLNDVSDIDLSESFHNNTTSYEDDNLCNHNGTYYHSQNDPTGTDAAGSYTPSSYCYADFPEKKSSGTKTAVVVTIVICLISILIPTILIVAITTGKLSQREANEEHTFYTDDIYSSYTDNDYDKGYIEDYTYYNKWANFQFDIPRRYEEAPETDYETEEDTEEECAFLAYKDDGAGTIGIYSCDADWLKYYSTKEIVEIISKNMDDAFADYDEEYTISSPYDRDIAGVTYLCFDIDCNEYGYASIALHRINSGYVYILVSESSQKKVEKILDSIDMLY